MVAQQLVAAERGLSAPSALTRLTPEDILQRKMWTGAEAGR